MPPAAPTEFDARRETAALLEQAITRRASDLHLEPTAQGYEARLRVDGILTSVRTYPAANGRSLVTRLMVQAQLLTYRLDIPQEGRFSEPIQSLSAPIEMRLAVMPTTHGLRAVVRLPAELTQPRTLDALGLPDAALGVMRRFLTTTSGTLILTGPAGSGKTTCIYALLEELHRTQPGLSIISLEDPVERDVPGVTQIEVRPFGELTYDAALRSILRQDPQVLALGEVRDPATATLAMQAAMGGHRLLSTLHAATPGGAIVRLLEMGLEPYQLTSGLFAVASLRLLRKTDGRGGYAGRIPIAECAPLDEPLREAIMARQPASRIDRILADTPGYQTLSQAAAHAVAAGLTDGAEVARALGQADPPVSR